MDKGKNEKNIFLLFTYFTTATSNGIQPAFRIWLQGFMTLFKQMFNSFDSTLNFSTDDLSQMECIYSGLLSFSFKCIHSQSINQRSREMLSSRFQEI